MQYGELITSAAGSVGARVSSILVRPLAVLPTNVPTTAPATTATVPAMPGQVSSKARRIIDMKTASAAEQHSIACLPHLGTYMRVAGTGAHIMMDVVVDIARGGQVDVHSADGAVGGDFLYVGNTT